MFSKYFRRAILAAPDQLWLRLKQKSLQVSSLLVLATVSQCNYSNTSNTQEVSCCIPVNNIQDCPCIITDDIIDG